MNNIIKKIAMFLFGRFFLFTYSAYDIQGRECIRGNRSVEFIGKMTVFKFEYVVSKIKEGVPNDLNVIITGIKKV